MSSICRHLSSGVVHSNPTFPFLENLRKLCEEGKVLEAVNAASYMEQQGAPVPISAYYGMIQSCIDKQDLTLAREVRVSIARAGFQQNSFLGSHLIAMFAACGSLSEANDIFNGISESTEFAWKAIISAHVKHGQYKEALNLYSQMLQSSCQLDEFAYTTVLKACALAGDIERGRLIHGQVIEDDSELMVYVGNTLIDMYCKCKSVDDGRRVFDKLPKRSIVTWSAMVAGYAQNGESEAALELYSHLHQSSVVPNDVMFASILKACSNAYIPGKLIHSHFIEACSEADEFMGATLIDMYAKCHCLADARRVFDRLSRHNVITWSTMLGAYVQHEQGEDALELYKELLKQRKFKPNAHTFVSILKACSRIKAVDEGKLIHSQIIEGAYDGSEFVINTLVDMYGKCGSLLDAGRVFMKAPNTSLVRFNAMLEGYSDCGNSKEAFELFCKMQDLGTVPDRATLVIVLKACSTTADLVQGRALHSYIIRNGCELDDIMGSTLIHMYSNCGSIEDAVKVFDGCSKDDIVTWNAMIAGYVLHRHGQEAVCLYEKICARSLELDKVTCISILKACSSIAALKLGKVIHACTRKLGCELDIEVGNALLDMYARCGSMEDANEVFTKMKHRDSVSWSTMVAGHAQHNDFQSALEYFQGMEQEGLKPNNVTFVSILAACSRKGLLDEASQHLIGMTDDHGISPTIDHCNCVVDLLSRAGRLKQAEELLDSLPFKSNLTGWTSLLTHCRVHSKVELGRRCFERMIAIDKTFSSSYVLMGNIYADAGMWEEVEALKKQRIAARAWKKPGKSFIEVDDKVHNFSVGDRAHPRILDIYRKLRRLAAEMKDTGCLPQTHAMLQQHLSDEDKEDYLCGHCEKLAIAFGLISTPPGTPIRVAKNLRVCMDCHSATKVISKLEGREIIVIDTYRVHRFKDGACSCKDYF
ncbi:hypothetical protein GOP47_0007813 [Adiantum capillus-veneris]|uniref:DYW domain-containing protein n=1 Tax=Adiantum capillus-veneris TaxID=13818 RepID=A0A9D4V1S7_ADICA|nr:hypothetical protein GOP47_0007813 [Adiantum capillus-veneris]